MPMAESFVHAKDNSFRRNEETEQKQLREDITENSI